jgi:hypothetical protein
MISLYVGQVDQTHDRKLERKPDDADVNNNSIRLMMVFTRVEIWQ